jgi:CopG-like RHH_1 or ribbon-helix-helix domain, RHH_5
VIHGDCRTSYRRLEKDIRHKGCRALVTCELADKVEALAADENRSVSTMVALLLEEALNERRKP